MTISLPILPNFSGAPNFHNLALFICHLFIDGQFHIGHILYDPNVFENQLITDIQLKCPQSIPWQMIDVTQPFSLPWTQNQSTDHILQMTFFDPDNFPKHIDGIAEIFTFHRLFVFFTINQDDIHKLADFEVFQRDNPMILFYNPLNGLIQIEKWDSHNETICSRNDGNEYDSSKFAMENMFKSTFGHLDSDWSIIVRYSASISCHYEQAGCKLYRLQEIWNSNPFFSHFLASSLNAPYVKRTHFYVDGSNITWDHQIYDHKNNKIIEELSSEYNIENGIRLENSLRNKLVVKLDLNNLPPYGEVLGNVSFPLYSQREYKLMAVFVYANFQRMTINNLFSKLKLFILNWTNLFVVLSAVVLCFVRRSGIIRGHGFIVALIDVMVIFTGGGNMRIDLKLERLFFVIVSIGAFFFNAICLGPTLFPAFLQRQQSIETFQQLAEIHPPVPIYIPPLLKREEHLIAEMLRKKMGQNIRFEGIESIISLLRKDFSFACIFPEAAIEQVKMYPNGIRDFDLLQEKLGSIPWFYNLESNQLFPERIKSKIEHANRILIESGISHLYETFTTFLERMRGQKLKKAEDDDFRALSIEELRVPLIFCSYLFMFAWFVFMIEIIYHELMVRRNS